MQYLLDSLCLIPVTLVLAGAGELLAVAAVFGLRSGWGFALSVCLGLVALAAVIGLQFWWFAYRPYTHGDQTLGMGWRGLRVVRLDGRPVSPGDHTVRWLLLWLVDAQLYGIVGLIIMSQSRLHQRLGDIATQTIVVRVPR